MCFSATASFVAAGALSTAGIVGISQTKTWPMKLYAAIPLFFGIQQAIEGAQWLYANRGTTCEPLGYSFLFFAFLVWPTLIPVVAYHLEREKKRRALLKYLVYLGVVVSTSLFVTMLISPLEVVVMDHSIAYLISAPLVPFSLVAYVFATCGSGMLSTRKGLRLLGTFGLLGLFVSWIAYANTFTSVWCFFAALISVFILTDIKRTHR